MSNAAAPRWLALMLASMLAAMALAANLGAMPLSLRALWRG
ncbi:MAG TPA: iron ABC transporter, partial [Pantoea sp.]|nr:iron ABC transporter [Pantoea sp.]